MTLARNDCDWIDECTRESRLRIGEEYSHEADLARLVELADLKGNETVLDFVTGLGFVARAFAPHVKKVDSFDPDESLLMRARDIAELADCTNIAFTIADPLDIPFKKNSFDIATARLALRHTVDSGKYLDEISRVLKPSGKLLVADCLAPHSSELVAFLESVMKLRDRSHISSMSLSELESLLEGRGYLIDQVEIYPKLHDFKTWANRAGAEPDSVRMLEMMLRDATPRAKRHFRIEESEGKIVSFATWMILIKAFPESAGDS